MKEGVHGQAGQVLNNTFTGASVTVDIFTRPARPRERGEQCHRDIAKVRRDVYDARIAFAQSFPVTHIDHRRAQSSRLNNACQRIPLHHRAVPHGAGENIPTQVLNTARPGR